MIRYIIPVFPPLKECIDDFEQVYINGHYSNNGPFVHKLENLLRNYLHTDRDIIMVNSATSGLFLAIKALSLEEKKILVPSFTFPATLGTIKWSGAKYRYIDINIDTYCIDDSLIENELNNDNIGAIIAVNCFGNVCNIDKIEKMAMKYNVKVIYDSAPALGSEINNIKVGNFGDIEVFSLHATKILPIGEGGFLSVKDNNIAQKIRQMKNFGFDERRNIVMDGLNFKLSEFSAIFGIAGLKYIEKYISNRRNYVKLYQEIINTANISKQIKFQNTDNCKSSYQGLTIRIDENYRNKLFNHLMKNGIECKKYFDPPLHKTYTYGTNQKNLYNTEKLSSQVLSIPLYSIMDESTIENIAHNIINYLK